MGSRVWRLPRRLLGSPIHSILSLTLVIIPALYLATLAQSLVLGDPTEFTFVANVLGIAHPPGYAFITLVGKAIQLLVPVGSIPWRMHLLSAVAATLAALFVFGTVREVAGQTWRLSERLPGSQGRGLMLVPALFAAFTVALAADFWQHALHANPHIITAAFLAANLFFLTRWWAAGTQESGETTSTVAPQRWLYAFCFSAGLGVTHHPLTVITFPAYALFILWVRPRLWREGRTLLRMVCFALLGLSVWLYFPIRSAMQPVFGPHNMDTLDGFLDHVLARDIAGSIPFYTLRDQADRGLVFGSLLRLQYSLPTLLLALAGLIWLAAGCSVRWTSGDTEKHGSSRVSRSPRPLLLLFGLALLSNYGFVINLRQQDVMAYLLGAFLLVGLLAGIGLLGLAILLRDRLGLDWARSGLLLGVFFLLGPVLQTVRNLPRISLTGYSEGDDYLAAVDDWFAGRGEGAVLLNDWEHMTPLWYAQFVSGRQLDPADVRPHLVAAGRTWLENVFDFLPASPVYLSGYKSEIVNAGFRLRPRSAFHQVVEPGEDSVPAELNLVEAHPAGDVEVVGYLFPERDVEAGDFVPFILAMRSPQGTADFYTPVLRLGETVFEFTTDSHLITPLWQPDEVIVERFDFALPHDLPGGSYPATVILRNLSAGRDEGRPIDLGQIVVTELGRPTWNDSLLANFRQRVGLVSATASRTLFVRRSAPWEAPILASSGDTIHLTLEWLSLAPAEESYTVFVHLIDAANRPLLALDYTPLGGSTPTHLWIPKWLPGQHLRDPYRVVIPPDLSPGTYFLEVGLYEMTSGRRLHISDPAGNLAGDRLILGPIEVH